jgi:hypothetical protein
MKAARKREWQAAIMRAHTLTPTTRLALLSLADAAMSPSGQLIKGIEKLAGGDPSAMRRLARHVQAAYEAGWLQQTSRGYRLHAATYIAVIPEPREWQPRRAKGGQRMTENVSQPRPERMTSSSRLSTPKKDDNLLSSHKEHYSASLGEHVAVNGDAADAPATTALAANHRPSAVTRSNEDEIIRAARVLADHGMLHADHSKRLIHDSQFAA